MSGENDRRHRRCNPIGRCHQSSIAADLVKLIRSEPKRPFCSTLEFGESNSPSLSHEPHTCSQVVCGTNKKSVGVGAYLETKWATITNMRCPSVSDEGSSFGHSWYVLVMKSSSSVLFCLNPSLPWILTETIEDHRTMGQSVDETTCSRPV